MELYIQILFVLFYGCTVANCHTNFTASEDFSKCKVHYSRSEVSYKTFYQIAKQHTNNSLLFDFHFSVLAPRDAHILLTPSIAITNYDPVYEIVLGAGSNTFSDIRRLQKKGTKSSKQTYNLLSSVDATHFWIHFSEDGLLEVGKEGEDIAFLSYRDPDPLPIKFFSFCTWGNVEAKWYFDCVREDGTNSISQEVKKPLTTREKLKMHLFSGYDPYVRPSYSEIDQTVIHLGLKQDHVDLDEMKSKLTVQGIMQLHWLDEKIRWDEKNFDNIEELQLYYRELWQPNLYLYNSASGPGNDFSQTLRLVVTSEGWVTWVTRIKMEVWCDASGLGHWPNDQHICDIQLGFMSMDSFIAIESALNYSEIVQQYASQWQITSIKSAIYAIPTFWNSEDLYSNAFVIRYSLRRNSNAYTAIYFSPIILIAIFLLVSFWIIPIAPYRISLYCFQLILLSFILTKLGNNIPAHPTNIPYLVLLYSYSFVAVLIALSFSILLLNWKYMKHTKPLPYFLYRFLSLNVVRTILYVHSSKFSETYNKLSNDNINSKDVDIQEMWNILCIAIDRILFFVYFILIVVFLGKQY